MKIKSRFAYRVYADGTEEKMFDTVKKALELNVMVRDYEKKLLDVYAEEIENNIFKIEFRIECK